MKTVLQFITSVSILTAPIANGGEEPTAGAKSRIRQPFQGSVYETAKQIKTMPRCKVTTAERSPCSVRLTTTGGKTIYIGSPGATKEVASFLPVLKEGHTYTLPDAFISYQKARK